MTDRYRIGVIGTGSRATAFAPQLYEKMPRAELFGLCDTDPDRLAAFVEAGKYANARTFTDPAELLAQDGLDAVIVTVPEFVHRDITIAALRAGKPVYIEKPVAHTLDAAYDMIEAQRETGVVAFVGFNLRASVAYNTIRNIVTSGVLGQIVHIDATEQLHVAHIASFMRRFHRRSSLNGGFLNSKCCHDLDLLQWMVGHEHRVRKISSFGGCNIFLPSKQPATHCRLCPTDAYRACPYKAPGSDDVRRGVKPAPKSNNPDLYPGDLCVFNDDKDLIDNQTTIFEWDNGVRGSFNLQGFQHHGNRLMRIWGERGVLDFNGLREPHVTVTDSAHGDVATHHFQPRKGGHGGTDALMIDRFLDAIERGDAGDSGLEHGLAASILAIKADESRLSGQTIEIPREIYAGRPMVAVGR